MDIFSIESGTRASSFRETGIEGMRRREKRGRTRRGRWLFPPPPPHTVRPTDVFSNTPRKSTLRHGPADPSTPSARPSAYLLSDYRLLSSTSRFFAPPPERRQPGPRQTYPIYFFSFLSSPLTNCPAKCKKWDADDNQIPHRDTEPRWGRCATRYSCIGTPTKPKIR